MITKEIFKSSLPVGEKLSIKRSDLSQKVVIKIVKNLKEFLLLVEFMEMN